MSLLDNWNKNAFSIYDSEERTVLKIIEKIFNSNKEVIEEVMKKTDNTGDHKGSWQGIEKPTMSEEGLRGTVEQHIKTIADLTNDITTLDTNVKNRFVTCYTLLDIQNAITTGQNVFIPSTVELEINTHITVNKPIKIVVEGSIRQTKTKTCIFLVTANDVTIEGGTYYGVNADTLNLPISYASAVILDKVNNCTIRGLKIYSCSYATGTDSGAAIYISGGKNNIIENCYIENCFHGINTDAVFSGTVSQRNIIRKNKIVSCKYGYVMDLQGDQYFNHIGDIVEDNIISNSLVNGLQLDDVVGGYVVKKNIVENSGQNGIVIMNRCGSGVIEDNITRNNNMCGIVINHITIGHIISNLLIRKNSIKANKTDGRQFYNVIGLTIDSNDIFDNVGNGIMNVGGTYPQKIKIINNEIAYNHGNGIYLVDVLGGVISNNSIYLNSNENNGVNSGVVIDRANLTTANIFIDHNIFWGEGGESQKYCIDVKASSYDFIVVTNNQLQGAITGGIQHSGSVKLKYNNGVSDLN